ncbi:MULTISPECIES: DUF3530 family protein [Nitrincola]|uniref:DUF3530 domain-containing protein n=1 Tax=Nitrincola nitratireducens TaxID=1229521 RepID=W9VQH3_9GAMM|nr:MULTISPECIES: DUF3530 family protein [Nitrincola]EXJ12700.1 hypothetical protein D791_00041 [Nitrincola nitratireducens]
MIQTSFSLRLGLYSLLLVFSFGSIAQGLDEPGLGVPSLTPEERLLIELPADSELRILDVSEDRFRVLIQHANQSTPEGALMLLADPEAGPSWLEQTHSLRTYMAEFGWFTLALDLPARQHLIVDTDAESRYVNQITERIRAAKIEIDRENIETLVVIALGRSAGWATDFLRQQPDMAHLIMIDPQPHHPNQWSALIEGMSALTEKAVIDIYPARLQRLPDIRIRANQAKRSDLVRYHSQPMKGEYAGWKLDMPWLNRQVRGAIKTFITQADASIEAKRAMQEPPREQLPPGRR